MSNENIFEALKAEPENDDISETDNYDRHATDEHRDDDDGPSDDDPIPGG